MVDTPPSREAEELFLRWVEGREAVAAEDVELLCGEHPDLAHDLRDVFARWRWLEEVVDVEPEPPDEPIPVDFDGDRYNLLDRIGAGGMGVVYDAWDTRFKRHLAMKVLAGRGSGSTRKSSTSRSAIRFLEEAQVMGQLDHPGVLPVHDLGVDAEGRLFFTMRRVEGHDFKTVLEMVRARSEGWNVTRALGVVARVCDTLAYAHSKGVIHRDLKPANVMVGRFGQTYVVDWGLARVRGHADANAEAIRDALTDEGAPAAVVTERTDEASDSYPSLLTAEGAVVGTPTYMAPEQARGELDDVGARADVYAVGAILYHLIAGRPPYAKQSSGGAHAVLREVIRSTPEPLESVASGASEELIAICEKAMARDFEDRYPTMESLANDLRAYLEDRVVTAYRTGALIEMKKWVRRNRFTAVALATAVLVFVAGAVAVAWIQTTKGDELRQKNEELEAAAIRIEEESARAKENELAARTESARATQQTYAAKIAAAQAELEVHRADFAREMLLACPEDQRGWEWDHLFNNLEESSGRLVDPNPGGESRAVSALALSEGRAVTGHADGILRIWDLESGDVLQRLQQGSQANALALSTDGTLLAVGGDDGFAKVWNLADGSVRVSRKLHRGGFSGSISSLAFAPAGDALATIGAGGTVHIARLDDLSPVRTLELADGRGYDVSFSPDGRFLATSSCDNTLRLWEKESGALVASVPIDDPEIRSIHNWDIAFSPDGRHVACGTLDGPIRIVDVEAERVTRVWNGHSGLVRALCFNAAGTRVVSGSSDQTVRVWDWATGECLFVGRGHLGEVRDAVFAVDGRTVVSAGPSARVWGATAMGRSFLLRCPRPTAALALSPDGRRAVSGGRGETVLVWDLSSGRLLHRLPQADPWCETVQWSPDGETIAAGFTNGAITLWDVPTLSVRQRVKPDGALVHRLAFHPRSDILASASSNGFVRYWDVETGALLSEDDAGLGAATHVVWSPDGASLVCGHARGTLAVRDESGVLETTIQAHGGPMFAGVFDHSGARFASGGGESAIVLWDTSSWTSTHTLVGHTEPVRRLSFTPDGTRLASASDDRSVRLWDPTSGEQVLQMHGPTTFNNALFSVDGELLLSSSGECLIGWRRNRGPHESGSRARDRDELRPYVQALLEEVWLLSTMIERIEGDTSLSDAERTAALELAQLAHVDLGELSKEAYGTVHDVGTIDDYRRALLQALAVWELAAPRSWIERSVAAGYARLGEAEKALKFSRRAREIFRAEGSVPPAPVPAFEALAELSRGNAAEARSRLDEARTASRNTEWEGRAGFVALIEELEARLSGETARSRRDE